VTTATVPRRELTTFLRELADVGFAVAKAPDLWGNLARGGDWDLVVSDVDAALRLLVREVGAPRRVERRSYVTSAYYPWGRIDLLPELAWRGVQLVSADDMVGSAGLMDDGIALAARPHQIIAACVYPLLAHGSYRERYRPLVAELTPADQTVLRHRMDDVFGPASVGLEELSDPATLRRLRRRATVRSLRTRRGWSRWASFLIREARLRAGRHWSAAPYAWIVGPDGCGKSTVAAAVAARTGALHLYWRPGILPLAGRWVGRREAQGVNSAPHSAVVGSPMRSALRVVYYAVDYVLGHWVRIQPARWLGRPVLVERGWWDMAVDARRYGLSGPGLVRWLTPLIRKPSVVVLVSARPSVIRARKPELTEAEIERQLAEWRALSWPGTALVVVDNEGPLDAVVDEVAALLDPGAAS
jgi:hypothetical protein